MNQAAEKEFRPETDFYLIFHQQGAEVVWRTFLEGDPAPQIEEVIWIFRQLHIPKAVHQLICEYLLQQPLTNEHLVRIIGRPPSNQDDEPILRACCERLCAQSDVQQELEILISEEKPPPIYKQLRLMLAEAYVGNLRLTLHEIVVRSHEYPDSLYALEVIQKEFPNLITPTIQNAITELRKRREWAHAFRNAISPR
jgi:hypothetical protein